MGCPELRCFPVIFESGDLGLSHHLLPDVTALPQGSRTARISAGPGPPSLLPQWPGRALPEGCVLCVP